MSRRTSIYFKTGICFTVLFLLFTFLLRKIDIKPIGPLSSEVGFSMINGYINGKITGNENCYNISQILGYLALAVCVCFFCIGIYQFFTNKRSIKSVSKGLLAIYGLYFVLALLYIFFDKFLVINYRPVLSSAFYSSFKLEPSYPSSHTLLSVCVFLSASDQIAKLTENRFYSSLLSVLCWICAIATVVLRFFSGVHWFTDIVGALLLSSALLCFYIALSGDAE